MRKLNGGDIFSALRMIRQIDFKTPVEEIGKQISAASTEEDKAAVGMEIINILLANVTDTKSEELIFGFLAGPFEKPDAAAVRSMEINELADNLLTLLQENDLRGFFGKVRRLIQTA